MPVELGRRHAAALCALRVSLGLLLVWWGIGRVVNLEMGLNVQNHFYFGLFDSTELQAAFGLVEAGVGALVALGLMRVVAVPAQLAITGFSAATIWSALLDPFGLWLPVARLAPVQHLFYPSVIALCAAAVMIVFAAQDR
ncbi:hypothetical protein M1105_11570 [Limibaculum sp. FT325]|uniref:hypothetical protein n=1 Tax=Thermohalobaculum sediminis TaxID=2939436 RepID=UPI0020BEF406|nr:hypothetical protein [Limibaculum sediminis]MCL5777621.1 hypothetical protein [Limibaculum sediminis]